MSELARLRMELKTDLELIVIHQGAMASNVEQIGARVEHHGNALRSMASAYTRWVARFKL